MSPRSPINIFWFRRDLRLSDNRGLDAALSEGIPVVPIFIFDPHILTKLEDKKDHRVSFIHETLLALNKELNGAGSGLQILFGDPGAMMTELTQKYKVNCIYTNHDYEPYARQRDQSIEQLLTSQGVGFKTFKDQVIFEASDVIKDDGQPYAMFTPYSRKWKSRLTKEDLVSLPSDKKLKNFAQIKSSLLNLKDIGFEPSSLSLPTTNVSPALLKSYADQRNLPAIEGTSKLGVHLRFGTVSIRETVKLAQKYSETWLNELIWREFFMQLLYHFPKTTDQPFKPKFHIQWLNSKKDFAAWKLGMTGYPLVDAGMRELNSTGFMHNRVRMVAASFLCKHLLIDWRWGQQYFASKLFDFDLSSNVGNWQWVAGSGADAAPYFRIFNPSMQADKFDQRREYIRQWVPEFESPTSYPQPIVVHEFARRRALAAVEKNKLSDSRFES